MDDIAAPITQRQVESHDGTLITYYVAGRGPERMILAPGLGTPFIAWKYIVEAFQTHYTLLSWDPRGTYRSAVPADRRRLRLEDHVGDMQAICQAEGLTSFVLGGWSMGVQIALEYTHRFPAAVRALVLINGAYEHVLATAFHLPGADWLLPFLLRLGGRCMPFVAPLMRSVLGHRTTPRLLTAVGIVANDAELFGQMIAQFSQLDWQVYFRLMLLLNEHSAASYLSEIRVPTLITAGTHDRMTPQTTARKLQAAIAGSQLFLIPKGTHYTMAEYPEILNLRLEQFLRSVDPQTFRHN